MSEKRDYLIQDGMEDLQWVFGGQYMSVPANSRINVELEVEVVGEAGRVELTHKLKSEETQYFGQKISDIQPGGRIHFRYSYSNAEPIIKLENYLVVTRQAGSGLSLNLLRARMRIRPESDASKPPLVVFQHVVERSPDPAAEEDAIRP